MRPGLCILLNEILIASSSYPIIGMSRSIPSHRRPNDLFLINLKSKLYLEQYEKDARPICVCGELVDVWGMHVFHCLSVHKGAMSNGFRNNVAKPLETILK